MKEKLESRGKKCNYKNYDLFPPKNDFCFETRDWMEVQPDELPTGSKLIMGLNPPFGVNASKANQFINKALQFKPKLLILIVPVETERLDKKQNPYDLIWEYKDKLSGKSFYLPGSVDTNDKQMEDWNVVAPNLYLWSRPDWTSKHKEIAKKHHHLLGEQRQKQPTNKLDRDSSFKIRGQNSSAKETENAPTQLLLEGVKEKTEGGNENPEKQSTHKDNSVNKQANTTSGNSKKKKKKNKKRHIEGVHGAGRAFEPPSQDFKRRRFSPDKPRHEVPYHSPRNSRDERESHNLRHHPHLGSPPNYEPTPYPERRFSMENRTSRYHKSPSNVEIGDPIRDHHAPSSYQAGNHGMSYLHERSVNYNPQHNMYPNELQQWPKDVPIRNPVDSTRGYMRSDIHSYGINQSYSPTVEQPPYGPPGPPPYSTDISGYSGMVNHNATSTMDKYRLRLDGSAH
ncbi:Protein ENHANCED DOWNY MILDEW 2 [Bienertia sinuspersici]